MASRGSRTASVHHISLHCRSRHPVGLAPEAHAGGSPESGTQKLMEAWAVSPLIICLLPSLYTTWLLPASPACLPARHVSSHLPDACAGWTASSLRRRHAHRPPRMDLHQRRLRHCLDFYEPGHSRHHSLCYPCRPELRRCCLGVVHRMYSAPGWEDMKSRNRDPSVVVVVLSVERMLTLSSCSLFCKPRSSWPPPPKVWANRSLELTPTSVPPYNT